MCVYGRKNPREKAKKAHKALSSDKEWEDRGFLTDSGNLFLIIDPDTSVFRCNRFHPKLGAGRNNGLFQVRHIASNTQLSHLDEKEVICVGYFKVCPKRQVRIII